MIMKLDNEFTVGVPIGEAWGVLTDLNDGVYTGKVRIKVGPVTAEYAGTARFSEKDEGTYRAVIDARGRDSRGNGNATAVISAQLLAEGESTRVTVTTDLTIAGRIAQFGSGMIKEVSAKLLGQFVHCLEGRLGGDLGVLSRTPFSVPGAAHPAPAAAASSASQATAAPAAPAVPAAASAASGGVGAGSSVAAGSPAAAAEA